MRVYASQANKTPLEMISLWSMTCTDIRTDNNVTVCQQTLIIEDVK
jgi:hypothetical protein